MKHKRFNQIKPYVYLITEKKTGLKYFGVRWRNVILKRTPKEDIGKKYFTSSTNKIFKKNFKHNSNLFIIKLIFTFDNKKEAIKYEHNFNKKIIGKKFWLNKQAYPAIIQSKETIERLTKQKIGRTASLETRKKLSNSLKGRIVSKETRKKISQSEKGKKITKSTRLKISEAQRGRKLSEQWKKNISKKLKGKQNRLNTRQSLETRKKISETSKGRKLSTKAKKKISKANTGKVRSEETLRKLSISHIGNKPSAQTRRKMSDTHKKRYQKNPPKTKYNKKKLLIIIENFIQKENRKPKTKDFKNKKTKKKYNLPSRDTITRYFGGITKI